jgi:hypothetical protein
VKLFDRLFKKTPPSSSASDSERPVSAKSPVDSNRLEHLIAEVESQLKSSRKYPIVRLRVREMLGKRVIAWSWPLGDVLDTAAAEKLLNPHIASIELKLGAGSFTRDEDGSTLFIWDVLQVPEGTAAFQQQIARFDGLEREVALKEGKKLVDKGEVGLLIGWLKSGKYPGIPAELLGRCATPENTAAVIELLNDSSSEIRKRGASALEHMGGGEQTARALCNCLSTVKDNYECYYIANALGKIAWPGAVGPLKDTLNRWSDADVRKYLTQAIARCGSSAEAASGS